MESQASNPPPKSCWSNIVRQNSDQKPPLSSSTPAQLLESCKSTKGIAVAVVDANAIIQGGERLATIADKFVSVSEVISEIRDPTSRHRLSFLPVSVDTLEPSPEALKKVISFARATGDLQTLSDVDLKLISLTYTLEAQIHGTSHLRDSPPPIHVRNVRRLPEKDLPGWGSNVPNLAEWEALETAADSAPNVNSKILPLKDLSLNIPAEDRMSLQDGSIGNGGEGHMVDHGGADQTPRRHRRYLPKKREVKIEGKKMVADGIDASQGQHDDDSDDWRPAVSRSTHRRYLRRKARHEMYEASLKDNEQQNGAENADDEFMGEVECHSHASEEKHVTEELPKEAKNIDWTRDSDDISSILEQVRLEEDALKAHAQEEAASADAQFDGADSVNEGDNSIAGDEELDHVENGSIDTSYAEDDGSEQSWMLRSLSDSSVACVTGDFAMQNVILQMGLRLLAPGGMQIRELHRWVLKCHACNNVTAEIGRIFCPKCGNGGTLRKVSVTVGENGVVLSARKPRISLRGTKFSIPLPRGGRGAVSKNPILREDQLLPKLLHPKTKKKSNQEDEYFGGDVIFSHHSDKKASHKPPVRQALAFFSGKRNPNDNHYSRSRSKH